MGHFYTPRGPLYEVPNKSRGGMRPATVRDAATAGAYPSVTTIINLLAKPALTNYIVDQNIDATIVYLNKHGLVGALSDADRREIKKMGREHASQAAQIGSEIHDAIEEYMGKGTCPEQHLGAAVAAERLVKDNAGPQDWKAEAWFCADEGYGGRIDLISERWVIDFKTKAGPAAGHKMYPEQLMQLVAYDKGMPNVAGEPRRYANVIVSRDDGSVKWWEWDDEAEQRGAWQDFCCLLEIYKRKYPAIYT